MNDRWTQRLRDAVEDAEPRAEFVDRLRHDLVDEWERPSRARSSIRWWPAAASAVLLVALVGSLLFIDLDSESTPLSSVAVRPTTGDATAPVAATDPQISPTPSSGPEPSATGAPATTATTSTTSVPASTPVSCAATTGIESFTSDFTEQLVGARESNRTDLIDDCIDTVPPVYDGTAPNCWTPCLATTRTFSLDAARSDPIIGMADDVFWATRLPVTYVTDSGIIDVIETWSTRQVGDRFVVGEFVIELPIVQRSDSTDVITEYFAHIADENWAEAANLLTRAASASFDERADLQQLGAASYDEADIAEALARWCADGCDATPPSPAELSFTGGYELTRNNQTVRAAWYEGTYGIYGPPIR